MSILQRRGSSGTGGGGGNDSMSILQRRGSSGTGGGGGNDSMSILQRRGSSGTGGGGGNDSMSILQRRGSSGTGGGNGSMSILQLKGEYARDMENSLTNTNGSGDGTIDGGTENSGAHLVLFMQNNKAHTHTHNLRECGLETRIHG
jgi:hypothetical protein